jgi:peptide/nickel transport system substrate-binding protein
MPAGAYTFDAALGVPRQDVAEARRLLAAAGYPNGFRLTLLAPNGSPIPNDARLAQAVAQQWTRIGVQVAVEALPQTAFAPRQARSAFGVTMGSWGATYGSVVSPFASVVGSRDAASGTGSFNFSRYSNPAVDALVRRSAAEFDDARREAILLEGVRLVAEDVGALPLVTLRNAWATRRGLVHQARADGWMMPTAIRAAP